MADSLLLQLNGLGKEERSRVVKAMVRKNPDILDNMDFNPLEMDDVLEVPSYPCFHLYSIFASHFFHLFPSCFFWLLSSYNFSIPDNPRCKPVGPASDPSPVQAAQALEGRSAQLRRRGSPR